MSKYWDKWIAAHPRRKPEEFTTFDEWTAANRVPESEWPEFGPHECHPELTEEQAKQWWDGRRDAKGYLHLGPPYEPKFACSFDRLNEEGKKGLLRSLRNGFYDYNLPPLT
jgi:hypothetical protein